MRLVFVLVLCGWLGAQQRSPSDLQQDLQRMRKELSEAEILEGRLLDLRIESDLGLSVDIAKYVTLTEVERGRDRERIEAELESSRQESAVLQAQLGELGMHIEARRRQLVEQAQSEPALVARPAPLVPSTTAAAPLLEPGVPVGAQSPPTLPQVAASNVAAGDEPQPIEYIKGSRDHSKVGRALFRAGKYEKAIIELAQAVETATPELIDLFYLARSHEQTGALDKADDLFARVEALDSHEDGDGKVTLGGWASAAHTARQHMSWQRDRGDWKPKLPIESIQWKQR